MVAIREGCDFQNHFRSIEDPTCGWSEGSRAFRHSLFVRGRNTGGL